ncbi:MAG: tRNA (5-methylaminomethyl-2-thiouridylate)-methyltransferase [Fusobacteriaceae bacterium]|jgi:tRNA-specific 2-thiouridylase|nr:tRNA (5-methylaminomethyl-2-thiouridylate)-methyltransferase [Fusobacteriaceae bacterium]
MSEQITALALFSGGLDSSLAIKIMQEQGVRVIALNFVSHFFGHTEKIVKMAERLGAPLEFVEFRDRHLEMLKNPVYGYGKNMNPCIDCHSLMFRTAGELFPKFGAKFVISGEVLGQRPMSQNIRALAKVEKLSGMGDLIVRPLCGKLLPPTRPVLEGWIDGNCLLDIHGRNRLRQMELIEKYGIKEYPTPGGGCLLTDPSYSNRLRVLQRDGFLEKQYEDLFPLLKKTRFYRLDAGKYLFVGRDDPTNQILGTYEPKGNLQIIPLKTPGPRIMMVGQLTPEEERFALGLFSRYCKVKGTAPVEVRLLRQKGAETVRDEIVRVEPPDGIALENKIKEYQIL